MSGRRFAQRLALTTCGAVPCLRVEGDSAQDISLRLAWGPDGVAYRRREGDGVVELRTLSGARKHSERWAYLLGRINLIAQLKHDSVCPIALSATDHEVPVLRVEWPNTTLRARLKQGPLAEAAVIELGWSLTRALALAHDLGMAHGALWPGAIGLRGNLAVLEFSGTQTSAVPSDLHGQTCRAPDERASRSGDIYALAAILHCAHRGAAAQSPAQPTTLEALPGLAALTKRMLADSPDDRPLIHEVLREFHLSTTVVDPQPAPAQLPEAAHIQVVDVSGASDFPSRNLGRYQLRTLIGEGGMGQVYLADDPLTGDRVALKLLNTPEGKAVQRFRREARLLASVDSPYVARLIDSGSVDDRYFLAMEYLEGPTLREYIEQCEALSEDLALKFAADIARGLADMHAVGVVHRDVKPSNVILVEDSDDPTMERRPVLCDLGIARRVGGDETAQITNTGVAVGTPQYMSPEQCSGKKVDRRTDVYSLAATLFVMLTGHEPYATTDLFVILSAQVSGKRPDPRELRPDISEAVANLVRRGLALSPDDRFTDASDFLEHIESVRRGPVLDGSQRPRLPEKDQEGTVQYTVELKLAATPSELWPHVSNTDRLNHAIGLAPVVEHAQGASSDGNGNATVVSSKARGFNLEWREYPFEWIAPRRFGVMRRFTKGPLLWYRSVVELSAQGDAGTLLRHTIDVAPRGAVGRIASTIEIGRRTRSALEKVYRRIEKVVVARRANTAGMEDPFEEARRLPQSKRRQLEAIADLLVSKGCDSHVVACLSEFLIQASAQSAARIRPREFARTYGLEDRNVLSTFLHAAHDGMLDLRWDVLCPTCRIASQTVHSLPLLADHGECAACDFDFEHNLARSVELIFAAHPQLKYTDEQTYCLGGPAQVPHIVAQVRLAAGERCRVDLNLEPGLYSIKSRGLPRTWQFRVSAASQLGRIDVSLASGIKSDRPRLVGDQSQTLVLNNELDRDYVVRVERDADEMDAVTAAEAMCLPEFRELFSDQVLAPGVLIGISKVIVLMAELVDTELLETADDRQLYTSVSKLRAVVEDAVERDAGSVVKFHGRGLLAIFSEPLAAVRAAVASLCDPSFEGAALSLVGGPAMVATVNQRTDYYGRLVSQATHFTRTSRARLLTISSELACEEGIVDFLTANSLVIEVSPGGVVFASQRPS